MGPVAVARHYVSVGSRQVHYRRAGSGPTIVLLHGGLGASATLTALTEQLADRFTVIAMDLPGCGSSSALENSEPTISDYASSVFDAIQALGLGRVHIYGKHTGAKVALALAVEHPEVLRHLFLDILSLAPAGDVRARVAAYAPPIEPVWHGGHLLELWHQVRNASLFFPWYEQTAANRLLRDLAAPEAIHAQVTDILCADADYRVLFAANYGMDARPALRQLAVPATILVHEGDPTASERDKVNALPTVVKVEVVKDGVATVINRKPSADGVDGTDAPPPVPMKAIPDVIARGYVVTDHGHLHVRMAGSEVARPLVVLHAGPGSTRGLEPLIRELAKNRFVIAFDTLGHGGSDSALVEQPEIGYYADAVLDALGRLGIGKTDGFGTHTGSLIAIEMALRDSERVGRLVLDGVPLFTPGERDDLLANYVPRLKPVDDGTHLVTLWHMLRDMTLFWPWYRHTSEGVRPFEPPDAEGVHRRMIDTIPALTTYHLAYSAAFRYPTRDRLPRLRQPALICAGPSDPLLPTLDECGRLARHTVTVRTPGGTGDRNVLTETVDIYANFLSENAN